MQSLDKTSGKTSEKDKHNMSLFWPLLLLPTWSIDVMAGVSAANLDHGSTLRMGSTFRERVTRELKGACVHKDTLEWPCQSWSAHPHTSFAKERRVCLACLHHKGDVFTPQIKMSQKAQALSPSTTIKHLAQ